MVIASPHNLRLRKHIGVVLSEYSSGAVSNHGHELAVRATCDKPLAMAIVDEAEECGSPVVGANYGAAPGPASDLPMDWGTLIPLSFFLREKKERKRIVIVTPARDIGLEECFRFGRAVAAVAERMRKRVAFVASADQAHAHLKSGPYGFSAQASRYDESVVEAVTTNNLRAILDLPRRLVDAAKPDSLWQMAMLAGVLDVVPMKSQLISYQVPTYYGMLCAGYVRES